MTWVGSHSNPQEAFSCSHSFAVKNDRGRLFISLMFQFYVWHLDCFNHVKMTLGREAEGYRKEIQFNWIQKYFTALERKWNVFEIHITGVSFIQRIIVNWFVSCQHVSAILVSITAILEKPLTKEITSIIYNEYNFKKPFDFTLLKTEGGYLT